jgi:hypothetical protein
VDAKSLTGRISTDAPHRSESARGHQSLILGDGRVELAFKSISGHLRLATAGSGSGAVVSPTATEPPAEPSPTGVVADVPAIEADDRATEPGDRAAARLAILRELENGAIDVETATLRLAELEDGNDA